MAEHIERLLAYYLGAESRANKAELERNAALARNAALEVRNATLEAQNAALEVRNATLEARNATLELALQRELERNTALIAEIQELRGDMNRMSRANTSIQEELDEKCWVIDRMEGCCRNLTTAQNVLHVIENSFVWMTSSEVLDPLGVLKELLEEHHLLKDKAESAENQMRTFVMLVNEALGQGEEPSEEILKDQIILERQKEIFRSEMLTLGLRVESTLKTIIHTLICVDMEMNQEFCDEE
jgi:hypothetical protein